MPSSTTLDTPIGMDPRRTELVIALRYVRLSSEDQKRRGLAIETQDDLIDGYLSRLDPPVIVGERFEDNMPGTRDDRPEWLRLLARARALVGQGKRVLIVAMRQDRFGRDVHEMTGVWKETHALGISLHTVKQGCIENPMMFEIQAVFDEQEVRLLGEKVTNRHAKVRANGYWTHGVPPLGYRWRDATPAERAAGAPKRVIEVDELTAWTVREIYRRLIAGETLRSVTRWAMDLPADRRGSNQLVYATVHKIARSPLYCGRFGKAGSPVQSTLERPVCRWEPLISDESWLATQERIDLHTLHPRQASGTYLLTGYLRCPRCQGRVCGATQRVEHRTPSRRYYCLRHNDGGAARCTWSAVTHRFDTPVRALLAEALGSIAAHESRTKLEAAWEALNRPPEGSDDRERQEQLDKLWVRARTVLANAGEMRALREMDEETYQVTVERQQEILRQVEAEQKELVARHPAPRPVAELPPLLEVARACADKVRAASIAELRPLLEPLVTQVRAREIGRGQYEIEIEYTGPVQQALAALEYQRTVSHAGAGEGGGGGRRNRANWRHPGANVVVDHRFWNLSITTTLFPHHLRPRF